MIFQRTLIIPGGKKVKDINTYYLVKWAGVDPRDGAPLWYDINGNITRNYNNVQDRVATKSSTPDIFGSVTNDLEYKNFRLRVQANYTVGGYAFSSLRKKYHIGWI